MDKRRLAAVVIVLVVLASVLVFVPKLTQQPVLPEQFDNPSNNSSIRFAQNAINGGTLSNAQFNDGMWNFQLRFNDIDGSGPLRVAAQNCVVVIKHYDFSSREIRGWLNYTVSGPGTQIFEGPPFSPHIDLKVYIDGALRAPGNGWSKTGDMQITITDATSNASIHYQIGSPIVFTSSDRFSIPAYNGSFSFTAGGVYPFVKGTNLKNDTWEFRSLSLNNYFLDYAALGHRIKPNETLTGLDVANYLPNNGYLSVSVQNCNVTITNLDLVVYPAWNGPHSGWLNYTVSGIGVQKFNLHYLDNGVSTRYTVFIDGTVKDRGNGWMYSKGWLTITGAAANVSVHFIEEPAATFTATDGFRIPTYNSTIYFVNPGGYDEAIFENNVWNFSGLTWNYTETGTADLAVSAKNCNMLINSFSSGWVSGGPGAAIDYNVTGTGSQTLNLNSAYLKGNDLNWSVTIDGHPAGKYDGWSVSEDGYWLTVTGATSHVSISYYYQMPVP